MKGTQAAIRAGYKANSAKVTASRLLTKANVQAALEVGFEERQRRTGITADKALRELARLAFSDVGALFDEQGRLKAVKDLSPDVRAAVASVKVVRTNMSTRYSATNRRSRRLSDVSAKTGRGKRRRPQTAMPAGLFGAAGFPSLAVISRTSSVHQSANLAAMRVDDAGCRGELS